MYQVQYCIRYVSLSRILTSFVWNFQADVFFNFYLEEKKNEGFLTNVTVRDNNVAFFMSRFLAVFVSVRNNPKSELFLARHLLYCYPIYQLVSHWLRRCFTYQVYDSCVRYVFFSGFCVSASRWRVGD